MSNVFAIYKNDIKDVGSTTNLADSADFADLADSGILLLVFSVTRRSNSDVNECVSH